MLFCCAQWNYEDFLQIFFLLLCSYFYNGGMDGESGVNPRSGKEKTNSMISPSPPSVNGKSEGDL